jgi:hypothetical protein
MIITRLATRKKKQISQSQNNSAYICLFFPVVNLMMTMSGQNM